MKPSLKTVCFAAILAVGILLLIWGINERESLGSELKEAVTGSPTDDAKWMMGGGIAGIIVGGGGLFLSLKKGKRG
ncbi:MAG: DUF3185 family protein [Phycisphaeraceae bacterium]|nr:DUF3185 family protein [Phycisphaeraceae bacterium]